MRSVKILHHLLLVGAGCLLVGLLLSGTASADEQGEQSGQSGQEGQGLIVVCRVVANRPMSLSCKPRKRSKGGVRANQPPDPDDEPIVIEIKEPPRPIDLGYGCIRAGVHEGTVRSDMEISPPIRCLGKKG